MDFKSFMDAVHDADAVLERGRDLLVRDLEEDPHELSNFHEHGFSDWVRARSAMRVAVAVLRGSGGSCVASRAQEVIDVVEERRGVLTTIGRRGEWPGADEEHRTSWHEGREHFRESCDGFTADVERLLSSRRFGGSK